MLRELLNAHNRGRNVEELTALAAHLVAENDRLRLENARLRAENRYLRRVLRDRDYRLLRRAQADAVLMGALHWAGQETTAAACIDVGISRRRWHWARALLKCSDLHSGGHGGFTVTDLESFDVLLAGGVERIEHDGMGLLRRNLVRNGYSGRHLTPRPSRRTSRDASRVLLKA